MFGRKTRKTDFAAAQAAMRKNPMPAPSTDLEIVRAKMADLGVRDVQPLIKVSRKRARAIASANSTPAVVLVDADISV